jgi:hypothetical protein
VWYLKVNKLTRACQRKILCHPCFFEHSIISTKSEVHTSVGEYCCPGTNVKHWYGILYFTKKNNHSNYETISNDSQVDGQRILDALTLIIHDF